MRTEPTPANSVLSTQYSVPRVALVTGSGKRRVGWYVADALAQRGYALAVHYYRSAPEAEDAVAHFRGHGVDAAAFQADLGDEPAARGLIDAALKQFGRLDVLANCASVWKAKRLEEITAADVRRNFEANVLGTSLLWAVTKTEHREVRSVEFISSPSAVSKRLPIGPTRSWRGILKSPRTVV